MKIEKLFEKDIARKIKGVITVNPEESYVQQELEEYVVTRELQKHFASFFEAYRASIGAGRQTSSMGVWISGFFGSGKSHFLKILSYILSNEEVAGKKPIDYFIDDHKIEDSMVLGDMRLAANTPADVILFNIDSKNEASSIETKDSIVKVFLKVFNEKQGYCGENAYIADLERNLDEKGMFQTFKEKFEEISGESWEDGRFDFGFVQDEVVQTLVEMDYMSEEAARNWCEGTNKDYTISIENFAKLVQKHIEKKGGDYHVCFMADEMGQYIGDDRNLMLNLQTVVEDLGRICKGKAWVVVTSQQNIDEVTHVHGNDFSKIQGRFDTRLALSSSNVDEVIRKRILTKKAEYRPGLSALYDNRATTLKNLILFKDTPEMKLYSGNDNFADIYPFVPYQFNLLSSVLTSIRINGAAGAHMAEGERSMLALFKESAVAVMNKEQGALVPFNLFYDALEKFIEHSYRSVIYHAWENDRLNPNRNEDCFDVNVLKVLFMIKYVDTMKNATVGNIASLMVTSVDEDRLVLQHKVEDALGRLTREMLVQKNGDRYVFLTNEEQEMNRAIEAMDIEVAEVTKYTSELIFDDLYGEKKYTCPVLNNRYSFPFNQMVDDRPFKAGQNYEITLRVLTPNSEEGSDEHTLSMVSNQSNCVLVVLPQDRAFLNEIQAYKKINRYILTDAGNAAAKYEQLKAVKKAEMAEHKANARLFLEEALKDADIYVNGSKIDPNGKDVRTRINDALGRLVDKVYHKLYYIDTAKSETDIATLFSAAGQAQLTIGGVAETPNKLALADVKDHILTNTGDHMKLSMKTITDRFTRSPYGFLEIDVQWLVAKLFRDGDIAWTINSEPITMITKTGDELRRYVTRKEFIDKLMIGIRKRPPEMQKKTVKGILKEVFGMSTSTDDDDALMSVFQSRVRDMKEELDGYKAYYDQQKAYPGAAKIAEGKTLLGEILSVKYANEFYELVHKKQDDIYDFSEDYTYIRKFFTGPQKGIFDKALHDIAVYEDSKNYIADQSISNLVHEMKRIVGMPAPYQAIPDLPEYTTDFEDKYNDLLNKTLAPILDGIDEAQKDTMDYMSGNVKAQSMYQAKFTQTYIDLKNKAVSYTNVASLHGVTVETETIKTRMYAQIDAVVVPSPTPSPNPNPTPTPKPHKTVQMNRLYTTSKRFKNKAEITVFINDLQKKLESELGNDEYIDLKF